MAISGLHANKKAESRFCTWPGSGRIVRQDNAREEPMGSVDNDRRYAPPRAAVDDALASAAVIKA